MISSRLLLRLSLASICVATGCGSSHDTTPDDGAHDAGVVPNDASTDDASPIEPGTPTIPGDLSLRWLTADDQIVFLNKATGALWISALTPDAVPVKLSDLGKDAYVFSHGSVVGIWEGLDADRIGTMSLWSKGTRLTAVAPRSVSAIWGANDKSGRVMFARNVAAGRASGEVAFASMSDLAAAKTVIADADLTAAIPPCALRIRNVDDRFVASYCAVGATRPKIVAVDKAGAVTALLEDSEILHVGAEGSTFLALSGRDEHGMGTLKAVSAAGGAPITLASNVAEASFTPDHGSAVYRTDTGALVRTVTTAAAPTVLVPSGVKQILGTSLDGTHALVATAIRSGQAADEQPTSDVVLVSLTAPGSATPLVATPTGGAGWAEGMYYSDPFTADGKRAIFLSDVKVGDDLRTSATLNVTPVAGGAPRVLASSVSNAMYYGTGGGVVFEQPPVGLLGPATDYPSDVSVVDTASDAPPRMIASAKELFYTFNYDRIVFTPRSPTAAPGIYVSRLP
jgi:hypothetical protein